MITEILRVTVDPTWQPAGPLPPPIDPYSRADAAGSSLDASVDNLSYRDGRLGRCAVCGTHVSPGRVYCSTDCYRTAQYRLSTTARERKRDAEELYLLEQEVHRSSEFLSTSNHGQGRLVKAAHPTRDSARSVYAASDD